MHFLSRLFHTLLTLFKAFMFTLWLIIHSRVSISIFIELHVVHKYITITFNGGKNNDILRITSNETFISLCVYPYVYPFTKVKVSLNEFYIWFSNELGHSINRNGVGCMILIATQKTKSHFTLPSQTPVNCFPLQIYRRDTENSISFFIRFVRNV